MVMPAQPQPQPQPQVIPLQLNDQPVIAFPKNILASKTFWANILAPVFLWLGTKYGLNLTPDEQYGVITIIMSVINVVLRLVTNGPVSASAPMRMSQNVNTPEATVLFSSHLDGPVILNPGVHEITVPRIPVQPVPQVSIRSMPEGG